MISIFLFDFQEIDVGSRVAAGVLGCVVVVVVVVGAWGYKKYRTLQVALRFAHIQLGQHATNMSKSI